MLNSLICFYTGHDPKRYSAIGGFICSRCSKVGGDLDDLGFVGEAYVSPRVLAKLETLHVPNRLD